MLEKWENIKQTDNRWHPRPAFGKKLVSVLTVSGFGSRILCISDVAAGENQNGHENCAALICKTRKWWEHLNVIQDNSHEFLEGQHL